MASKNTRQSHPKDDCKPATSLWKTVRFRRQRPRAFKAEKSGSSATLAERQTRRALAKHLGIEAGDETNLAPRKVEENRQSRFTRGKKIILRTGPPRADAGVHLVAQRPPTVPLPHSRGFPRSTGTASRDIVGLWEDGGERDEPDGVPQGLRLGPCAALAFAVARPRDFRAFGERQTDFSYLETRARERPSTCTHHGHAGLPLGHLGGRHPRARWACG